MSLCLSPFPVEWGPPVGTQFSEERARWVRERVAEYRSPQGVRRRAARLRGGPGAENVRRLLHLHELRPH